MAVLKEIVLFEVEKFALGCGFAMSRHEDGGAAIMHGIDEHWICAFLKPDQVDDLVRYLKPDGRLG